MKLKILRTTDNKHQGEVIEITNIPKVGSRIKYKELDFTLENITTVNDNIRFSCSNYVVTCKIVD